MSRATLTNKDLNLMRHALGTDRGGLAYRNYYNAGTGSDNDKAWRALCTAGYAEADTHVEGVSGNGYRVTEAGRRACMVSET